MRKRFPLACWGVLLLVGGVAIQAEAPPSHPDEIVFGADTEDKYCGLYCLYAFLSADRRDVDFTSLVKPQYVSSLAGSSLADLERAAKDHGVHAVPVTGMTTSNLAMSNSPMIIHVKATPTRRYHDHFVLYLGVRGGEALIYDPPHAPMTVPFAFLSRRWDGAGLLISNRPVSLARVAVLGWTRFAGWALLAVCAMFLARSWQHKKMARPHRPPRLLASPLAQAAVLCAAATALGATYHGVASDGFIANRRTLAQIEIAHSGNFLPKIGTDEVRRLIHDRQNGAKNDSVFIDARVQRDFATGHLPGSINVPVNATASERAAAMRDVPKGARLIVYCESPGCKYAEIVSAQLLSEGYRDIALYKPGWRGWEEQNRKDKRT